MADAGAVNLQKPSESINGLIVHAPPHTRGLAPEKNQDGRVYLEGKDASSLHETHIGISFGPAVLDLWSR